MSVGSGWAFVEEAIHRARALVSPTSPSPGTVALGDVDGAVETSTIASHLTNDSSGALITAYREFGCRNTTSLSLATRSEGALQAELATAAALSHRSARHMDAIAASAHATLQAGAGATSPAAQRIIVTALLAHLRQASEVVDSISRQGAALAGRITALEYQVPDTPEAREIPVPQGPIVWCLRPHGTFGSYRCSILYPDLSVSTYWSPTDDTSGSS
jgi:hypothetical protein